MNASSLLFPALLLLQANCFAAMSFAKDAIQRDLTKPDTTAAEVDALCNQIIASIESEAAASGSSSEAPAGGSSSGAAAASLVRSIRTLRDVENMCASLLIEANHHDLLVDLSNPEGYKNHLFVRTSELALLAYCMLENLNEDIVVDDKSSAVYELLRGLLDVVENEHNSHSVERGPDAGILRRDSDGSTYDEVEFFRRELKDFSNELNTFFGEPSFLPGTIGDFKKAYHILLYLISVGWNSFGTKTLTKSKKITTIDTFINIKTPTMPAPLLRTAPSKK